MIERSSTILVFACLCAVATVALADDPLQYDTGYKTVLLGHSQFAPSAGALPNHVAYCGYLRHEQVFHMSGGSTGTPGWLWTNVHEDESVKAVLRRGGNELLGFTAHYVFSEVEDYQHWIDLALANNNPGIKVFIMMPYPPHEWRTYADMRTEMDNVQAMVHGRLDALRALYPDLEFFCIPTGEGMLRLWQLVELGQLPEVLGDRQDTGDPDGLYLYNDNLHGSDIVKELSHLLWLASIYKLDVRKYTDRPPFTFDLRPLAWDIATNDAYALFSGAEHANHGPMINFGFSATDGKVYSPGVSVIGMTPNTWDPDGTVSQVDYYVDGLWMATDTAKAISGYLWTSPTLGIHTLTMTASDAEEGLQHSTTSRILVPGVNGANVAPTISLTSPADGDAFNRKIPLAAVADAQDSDDEVFVVEFRLDGRLKGMRFGPPYACNLGVGEGIITAKVYDLFGASATAQATVTEASAGAGNAPPGVVVASPEQDRAYAESESLVAVAQPVDIDGTLVEVEFYVDGVLSAEITAPPYELDLNHLTAGDHQCSVLAFDDEGAAAYRNVEFSVKADVDSDGDGVPDAIDAFPNNPNEWEDADGDGLGDNFEQLIIDFDAFDGIDSLDDVDPVDDFDGDDVSNYHEFMYNTDPTDGDTELFVRGIVAGLLLLLSLGAVALRIAKSRSNRRTPA